MDTHGSSGDAVDRETAQMRHAEAAAAMTVEVAHRLRESLTVLLLSLEQLQRQHLDDHCQELLQRGMQAAGQITDVVNRAQPMHAGSKPQPNGVNTYTK